MKIEATKDFKHPRAAVLRRFRDPERFEIVLRGMGAQVTRTCEPPKLGLQCSVVWREEARRFTVVSQETAPDETFGITLDSDMALAEIVANFYDLPDGGCRVMATAELTAHNMMAKLALQSLRLVRGKAEERLTRFLMVLGRA